MLRDHILSQLKVMSVTVATKQQLYVHAGQTAQESHFPHTPKQSEEFSPSLQLTFKCFVSNHCTMANPVDVPQMPSSWKTQK